MDDEAALLAAIAAHPGEDTPRLAYSDWLEEHDRPIRAEFIRVQCEIKKYEHLPSSQQQGYAELYRRQDALLTHHRRELLGPLGDELTYRDVIFDRGFVTELTIDAVTFIRHADIVAALKPLPDVTVTDAGRWIEPLYQCRHIRIITSLSMQSARRSDSFIVGPEDIEDGLADYVQWERLRVLNLEQTRLDDAGLIPLVRSPNFPALTDLDLSHNDISDVGIDTLVRSPLWPRLRNLNLDGNPISNVGAELLADAPPSLIEYLNLRFTGIGIAGQQRLLRRGGWNVALF